MALQTLLLVFSASQLLLPFVHASSNYSNYTVGFKVSSLPLWWAGTGDDMYFQLCNDDKLVETIVKNTSNGTNTTHIYGECLDWYVIEDGMPNTGAWYSFDFNNQDNIYPITSAKLLTKGTDNFCLSKFRLNGTSFDNTLSDCIGLSSSDDVDDSCSVIDITIDGDAATFENTHYDGSTDDKTCPYNVTGAYVGPPTPTANGTRTYEIELEVSSFVGSGTDNNLYLRLCTDQWSSDCTRSCNDTECVDDWYVFTGGVPDSGDIWSVDWNTDDIGNVSYADIVIYGDDTFGLSYLKVDGVEANAGTTPEEIPVFFGDGDYACSVMHIDIEAAAEEEGEGFYTGDSDQCALGIRNNDTSIEIKEVIFEFKIGSSIACGANFEVYFIFCDDEGKPLNYDGHCSDIYQIGEMGDEGETYTFDIDVSDLDMFETLDDVFRVDMWAYDTDQWCLSDVTVEGKSTSGSRVYGPNADSTPAVVMETEIGSDAEQADYCAGVVVHPFIVNFKEFSDGPDAEHQDSCRWNTKLNADGYTSVSSVESQNQTFFEWVTANWLVICLVLVALVIVCIVGCAFLQKKRKEQIERDGVVTTSGQWHGGNAGL